MGEFESEALLVPEGCHFGHVDDKQTCEKFSYWNKTAQNECARRSGGLNLRSFSILEPCGLDMFSGVEFVCCPSTSNEKAAGGKVLSSAKKSVSSVDDLIKKVTELPIDLRMKVSISKLTGCSRNAACLLSLITKISAGSDKTERNEDSSEEEDDDEEDDDDVIEVRIGYIGLHYLCCYNHELLLSADRDGKAQTINGHNNEDKENN